MDETVSVVQEKTLPTQLFLTDNKPTVQRLHAVQTVNGWMKPLGGLWTSTYDEVAASSAWNDLCTRLCSDGKAYRETWRQQWWLLSPEPCRMCTIDTFADFTHCLARYGYEVAGHLFIDFERLAQEADAFAVTARGYQATREGWPYHLSLWDCESTIWFRWCFCHMEQI